MVLFCYVRKWIKKLYSGEKWVKMVDKWEEVVNI